MKYPKPWEAGWPAGKPYVSSSREGSSRAGQVQLATYVNRPGTPHHGRLVRTWLSIAEAEQLRDELSHHIDMMRRATLPAERSIARSVEPVTGVDPRD